jgi:hypothetical protein
VRGLLGSVKVAKIPTEQSWSGASLSFNAPTEACSAPCHVDFVVNALVTCSSILQHSAALFCPAGIFFFHAFSPGSRVD